MNWKVMNDKKYSSITVAIAGILVILSSAVIFMAAAAAGFEAHNASIAQSARQANSIVNTTLLGNNFSSRLYSSYRNSSESSLRSEASSGYVLGAVALVDGLLLLVSAFFISKEAERSKKWPVLAFLFSAISIFFGGGFILGFFLGMAGAWMGMGASRKFRNQLNLEKPQ